MWISRHDYLSLTGVERRAFASAHNDKVKRQAKGGR